jgi:acyl-CoA synthetase (AMP-forming)/AMP-acid ligase II
MALPTANGQRQLPYGRRLLPHIVDEIAATDPNRAWAAIPRDSDSLTAGYLDLTYSQYANAINRAARYLTERLGSKRASFEPLAYAGPADIRYPVFAVAAIKAGFQVCRGVLF